MIIYAMSDIHGFAMEFEEALSLVLEHLEDEDTKLVLLGDYIHGGGDSKGVLDRIIGLQKRYGSDKVIALLGNHEEFVLIGDSSVNSMFKSLDASYEEDMEEEYVRWMESLPRYYVEDNTIFVHAGIDEEAGELWEWGTAEEVFTSKYPAEIGEIPDLAMKVVAGHVSTEEISGERGFYDIYYDGASHYYIDGNVKVSGRLNVIKVDTKQEKYYRVTESGDWLILMYEEEN